jgi:hypothetical protein
MGILQLKSLLHDVPGIDGLTMQTLVDRDTYSIAGKVVRVPIGANEAQVEQAIRAAVLSPAAAPMPAGVPLAPESPDAGAGVPSPTAPATNSAALIPSVDLPTNPGLANPQRRFASERQCAGRRPTDCADDQGANALAVRD